MKLFNFSVSFILALAVTAPAFAQYGPGSRPRPLTPHQRAMKEKQLREKHLLIKATDNAITNEQNMLNLINVSIANERNNFAFQQSKRQRYEVLMIQTDARCIKPNQYVSGPNAVQPDLDQEECQAMKSGLQVQLDKYRIAAHHSSQQIAKLEQDAGLHNSKINSLLGQRSIYGAQIAQLENDLRAPKGGVVIVQTTPNGSKPAPVKVMRAR